jgi:hypothetical protein
VGKVPGAEIGVGVEIGLDAGVGVGADDVPHAPMMTARTRTKVTIKAVLCTSVPPIADTIMGNRVGQTPILVAYLGFPQ